LATLVKDDKVKSKKLKLMYFKISAGIGLLYFLIFLVSFAVIRYIKEPTCAVQPLIDFNLGAIIIFSIIIIIYIKSLIWLLWVREDTVELSDYIFFIIAFGLDVATFGWGVYAAAESTNGNGCGMLWVLDIFYLVSCILFFTVSAIGLCKYRPSCSPDCDKDKIKKCNEGEG